MRLGVFVRPGTQVKELGLSCIRGHTGRRRRLLGSSRPGRKDGLSIG
jgi:hypothetical protein